MRSHSRPPCRSSCVAFAISAIFFLAQPAAAASPSLADLPLRFEPNRGQAGSAALYLARGPGHDLSLDPRGATLTTASAGQIHAARLTWLHANPRPRLSPGRPLAGKSNYLFGSSPAAWRTGIPHFASVTYERVYPGVDLVFYGNARRFEFDFVVAPEADTSRIELAWDRRSRARLTPEGGLEIRSGRLVFEQKCPVAWQDIDGRRVEVAASYSLEGNRVKFNLGPYDHSRPLTIDPILEFSTHSGGGEYDMATAIAVDSAGNSYIAGYTGSPDFTTTPGVVQGTKLAGMDAAILKLSPDGSTVLYSTFLGGSMSEYANGIALAPDGSVVIAGYTTSTDFPVTAGAFQTKSGGSQDAFISRLSPAGDMLLYSSFLGGSSVDSAYAVALDSRGAATICGSTSSRNFPLRAPLQDSLRGSNDAFITRLDPSGSSLAYSTLWGGGNTETLRGVAVDPEGAAYVTGTTTSADFPIVNSLQSSLSGQQDIYVLKLSPAGDSVVYSTYLGGNADENSYTILTGEQGEVYVAGATRSTDFPVTQGAYQTVHAGYLDAVIVRLSASGGLLASTFFGGRYRENLFGMARDTAGNIVAAGFTSSSDLPLADPLRWSHAGSVATLVQSLDGGASWEAGGYPAADYITMIVSDPSNPDVLYAAASSNDAPILKSLDSGVTWAPANWTGGISVTIIAVDPSTPSRVYAGSNTGLYISEDAGATWNQSSITGSVTAIAISPSSPNLVFVGASTLLYKSSDSGATWSRVTSNLPASTINCIAIDPANPQVIHAGLASNIYKSVNGGASWTTPSFSFVAGATSIFFDSSDSRTIYAVAPAGVYRWLDASGVWFNVFYSRRRINHVVVHPQSPNTLYAATEVDGVLRSVDGGFNWVSIQGGKLAHPTWVWIDPRNPDRLLAAGMINTDVLVAKFNPDLTQLLFSTYFGGAAHDGAYGVGLDAASNIYVAGYTNGLDFPVTPYAVPPLTLSSTTSAFLFKIIGVQ